MNIHNEFKITMARYPEHKYAVIGYIDSIRGSYPYETRFYIKVTTNRVDASFLIKVDTKYYKRKNFPILSPLTIYKANSDELHKKLDEIALLHLLVT